MGRALSTAALCHTKRAHPVFLFSLCLYTSQVQMCFTSCTWYQLAHPPTDLLVTVQTCLSCQSDGRCLSISLFLMHRTTDRPSREALSHAVAIARACLRASVTLLEGPQVTPDPLDSSLSDASDGASSQLQAALLAALFKPDVSDMDVLVSLRREALPQACRTLPPPLAARPQKRLAQPDALSRELETAKAQPPPKRARAFLDAFPEKALESRGPEALRAELLVGFEPLTSHLLPALSNMFSLAPPAAGTAPGTASTQQQTQQQGQGHQQHGPMFGTLCADTCGGRVLGLKWSPAAFLASAQKVRVGIISCRVSCAPVMKTCPTVWMSTPLTATFGILRSAHLVLHYQSSLGNATCHSGCWGAF